MNQPVKPDEKKPLGVQDLVLNALRLQRVPVSVYLVNGIKLQGEVVAFDQYAVVLRGYISQMIFKHAISTVVPSRNVEWRGSQVEEKPELQPEPQLEYQAERPIAVIPPPAVATDSEPPRPRPVRKRKKKDETEP